MERLTPEAKSKLRKHLIQYFPEKREVKLMCHDIEVIGVDFDGTVESVWGQVIASAQRHGRLRRLINLAQERAKALEPILQPWFDDEGLHRSLRDPGLVYFSVADRQIESLLDPQAFDRSLVRNFLFQSSILIPDIFCFISSALDAHVNDSASKSLFEACLEHNIIIPAFREPGTSTFEHALEVIRGNGDPASGIQGINGRSTYLANRLQKAFEKAMTRGSGAPIYWPDFNMGEKFDHVLRERLIGESPPFIGRERASKSQRLIDLWQRTERWRVDCIHEAREHTQRIAKAGVRRGEIMNAVGRSLGLPPEHRVQDASELLVHARSRMEQQDLQVYLRWIAECYHCSQAAAFNAVLSFPCFDPVTSVIAGGLLTNETPDRDSPLIREEVQLPSIGHLLRSRPDGLVEARMDKGLRYFTALEIWQRTPSLEAAAEVRKALHQYAREICRWSRATSTGTAPLRVLLTSSNGDNRWGIRRALRTITRNVFLAVSPVGWEEYAWPTEAHTLEFRLPEVVLPAKVRSESNLNLE